MGLEDGELEQKLAELFPGGQIATPESIEEGDIVFVGSYGGGFRGGHLQFVQKVDADTGRFETLQFSGSVDAYVFFNPDDHLLYIGKKAARDSIQQAR